MESSNLVPAVAVDENRREISPVLDSKVEEDIMTPFRRKFKVVINYVKLAKIEPAILLHMIAFKMFYLTLQNIMLEKACRVNLGYSDDICDNLTNRDTDNLTMEEKEVQKFVAGIIRWKSLIDNFFPLIFVVFLGAWSDKYGRKLPIVLPVVGYVSQTIGVIFCLADQNASAYSIALVASILVAITGSIATFNMAVFSYIADITPHESRTIRTGITNAAYLMGMSAGNSLGGLLSGTDLGFEVILGISGTLDAISLAWILFFVKNDNSSHTLSGGISESANNPNSTKLSLGENLKTLSEIFTLKNLLDAGRTVLKKRNDNDRVKIYLLIFGCYFFVTVPEYGEESVFYLFLRLQLNWDAVDYGLFSTYRILVGFIGGLIAIGLFSHILHFHDSLVGIICSCSQISACFVYAFAKTTEMMYMGPAVDSFNSTMSLVAKVMIAKIVPSEEIGKVYAFMGCVDAIVPLIANPLYTTVYTSTLDFMPGLFFLLSGLMTIPPVSVFAWLFYLSLRQVELHSPTTTNAGNPSSPLCSTTRGSNATNYKSNQD